MSRIARPAVSCLIILLTMLFDIQRPAEWLSADEGPNPGIPEPDSGTAIRSSNPVAVAGDSGLIRTEMAPEAIQFIRQVVLLLLPSNFEDDDGWGDETRIQSGVNVRMKGGQLRTSRRWKDVNHGSWRQASGALVEPETTFRLNAARLDDSEENLQRYEIRISARLRVTGRQQQWNYGLMLWSVSADAIADISLLIVFEVKSEIVKTSDGTRLRFLPNVTQAAASLDGFDLRRISHAKGSAVRELGSGLETLLRQRVKRENRDLAARINAAIRKKPERLEIPFEIGNWFAPP